MFPRARCIASHFIFNTHFSADSLNSYISLGIDCHKPNKYARDLFHIVNKGHGTEQHRHNAVEVACYNMASFMYETETGKVYEMSREHEIFSGLGTVKEEEVIPEAAVADSSEPGKTASTDVEAGSVGGDEEEEEEDAGQDDEGNDTFDMGDSKKKVKKVFVDADVATSQEQALQRALNIASTWDGVKVFPLGGDGDPSTLTDVFRRARFDKLFDVVWVANLQVHHLTATPESKGVQASGCMLTQLLYLVGCACLLLDACSLIVCAAL